jgi:glyoxylase-like metal-dependent hydrolase (beta-lactamase superfamily II)
MLSSLIEKFYWLSNGYCTAPEKSTLYGGAWSKKMYQARFAILKHAKLGWMAFDTGYSSHYTLATKKYPGKLLDLLIPSFPTTSNHELLATVGCSLEEINHVLISHLHADHIGGAKDFAYAKFHCHEEAIDLISNNPTKVNLKEGFLPDLLPKNILQRTQPFQFNTSGEEAFPMVAAMKGKQLADIFGDRSLLAIPIPGHATGMTGLLFNLNETTFFLCADTTYHLESIQQKKNGFAAALIGPSKKSFLQSFEWLCQLESECPEWILLPTHCDTAANQLNSQMSINGHQ